MSQGQLDFLPPPTHLLLASLWPVASCVHLLPSLASFHLLCLMAMSRGLRLKMASQQLKSSWSRYACPTLGLPILIRENRASDGGGRGVMDYWIMCQHLLINTLTPSSVKYEKHLCPIVFISRFKHNEGDKQKLSVIWLCCEVSSWQRTGCLIPCQKCPPAWLNLSKNKARGPWHLVWRRLFLQSTYMRYIPHWKVLGCYRAKSSTLFRPPSYGHQCFEGEENSQQKNHFVTPMNLSRWIEKWVGKTCPRVTGLQVVVWFTPSPQGWVLPTLVEYLWYFLLAYKQNSSLTMVYCFVYRFRKNESRQDVTQR
jgi:hypothetical protein